MEHLLLIEDREGLRQVYASFLRSQGYAVYEAGSVEEAKKTVERNEFALVLSDYMLPGGKRINLPEIPQGA